MLFSSMKRTSGDLKVLKIRSCYAYVYRGWGAAEAGSGYWIPKGTVICELSYVGAERNQTWVFCKKSKCS